MDGRNRVKEKRKVIMKGFIFVALTALCLLCACGSKEKVIRIAATPVPHADLLEIAKKELDDQGITLKIVEVDDYNLPNRLLHEKQVDANFFQHQPYLDEQNRVFGYNLIPLAKVHIEPMGVYSERIKSLEALKEGAKVAIPSDPANESRALKLLSDLGLITLKTPEINRSLTIYDIDENSKRLSFEEVDSPFLPRALDDVDIAIIPTNFALQAKLNPLKDALALESGDSPYANIVTIRNGDEKREDLQKLKKALNSEKMKAYINEKYHGSLTPAF